MRLRAMRSARRSPHWIPFNNIATGYLGTAHFTAETQPGRVPADYTFVGGDNGSTRSRTLSHSSPRPEAHCHRDRHRARARSRGRVADLGRPAAAALHASSHPRPSTAGARLSRSPSPRTTLRQPRDRLLRTGSLHQGDGTAGLSLAITPSSRGDNGTHTSPTPSPSSTAGNRTVTATDTFTGTITARAARSSSRP